MWVLDLHHRGERSSSLTLPQGKQWFLFHLHTLLYVMDWFEQDFIMKNVVTYFHLCQTLASVQNDINKKIHLLLKVHATPMWIGPSWSWYPYSWTFNILRICCWYCWSTMFSSSISLSKSKMLSWYMRIYFYLLKPWQ